jgi:predicted 3-demethylubiquinone-9 3-methyltransferase (glyoxalase superfamily)
MQKITPCLWFDHQAEEAAAFYVSLFKNARVGDVARFSEEGAAVSGKPAGSTSWVYFELEGQRFLALNGGPLFTFSPAISFIIDCETQEEVDRLWEALGAGGEFQPCGWVRDRFGVTWQVVPAVLDLMLGDAEPKRRARVEKVLYEMTKIDIAAIEAARRG